MSPYVIREGRRIEVEELTLAHQRAGLPGWINLVAGIRGVFFKIDLQLVDFGWPKAGERNVQSLFDQHFCKLRSSAARSCRSQPALVVSERERSFLRLRKTVQYYDRHTFQAVQFGRLQAAVPCDHTPPLVGQDRDGPADCLDALGDLIELRARMHPRIVGVRLDLIDGQHLHLKFVSRPCCR
jgi:hypothetical protein